MKGNRWWTPHCWPLLWQCQRGKLVLPVGEQTFLFPDEASRMMTLRRAKQIEQNRSITMGGFPSWEDLESFLEESGKGPESQGGSCWSGKDGGVSGSLSLCHSVASEKKLHAMLRCCKQPKCPTWNHQEGQAITSGLCKTILLRSSHTGDWSSRDCSEGWERTNP